MFAIQVTLTEDQPEIVALLLTWLITGSFEDAAEYASPDIAKGEPQVLQLFKTWVFGDVIGAETFRNAVMDIIVTKCRESSEKNIVAGSTAESIRYVFTHTPSTSLLRLVLVENFFSTCDDKVPAREFPDEGIAEFYYRLAMLGIKVFNSDEEMVEVWERDPCYFHQHQDQPEGYTCTGEFMTPLMRV